MIYKNRRIVEDENAELEECGISSIGVNLLNNFPYKFASDDLGSSGYICDPDYRGPEALSETESAGLVKLLKENQVKFVLNLLSPDN